MVLSGMLMRPVYDEAEAEASCLLLLQDVY